MKDRQLFLHEGVGESRAVVTQGGLPERLIFARDGDSPAQAVGARSVARVRKVDRALAMAFLDLGGGPEAVLNLRLEMGRLTEGLALEVEIRSEARGGKGASVRLIGAAEGAPRLLAPGLTLEEQLREVDPKARIIGGPAARDAADEAEAEVLETVFPLAGGGTVAIERTRALISVDVDVGERPGAESKSVTRAANLAAFATAARVLRLKGEGGLVVFDLAGRGHDGPALLGAARAAFGPDNPGVALGPISRFGTLELTVPRRRRPAADWLTGADGRLTVQTVALRLIRAFEREAVSDSGARLRALAAPEVALAARPHLKALEARFGARFVLQDEPDRPRERFEIATR